MRKNFLVSATHVSPNYCFDRHAVQVSQDRYDGTWYANAAKLGCGKNYRTWQDAISGLFQAHACTVTKIVEA